MDIENMHPFCLPFSLCHDATSSSIIDEDYAKLSDGDKPGSNQVKSGMDDTSLLMDDPIDRLTCSNTPQCSIINEDHFIGSSSSGSSHDVFDLLDMEMRTDSDFELGDINSDDICNKSDDWFSLTGSHDCSLFSPVDENAHHRTHNKLHLKSPSGYSSSHQVFQHIVDPVDIKSSPTLAQLNLNSTEDPSDGLWDSTSAATTTSTTSTLISSTAHHHHHHHHHLNSSSPSDLSSSVSSCNNLIGTPASATSCAGGHFVSTCSHLGNHLQSNRFDESSAQHTSHLSNLHLHSCQHHPYHSHYHQHVNHDVRHSSSNSQSTCLAVAPFRKGTIHTQQGNSMAIVHPGCCSNHSQDHHLDRYNASSPGMQVQPQLLCAPKLRTNLNQNQSTHLSSACHQSIGVMDKNGVHRVHQQRCHSPVPLVTSSSSPLSSSTTHNLTGENRGENKLKENIEYLTVLLCNGSKKFDKRIVNQQAQPEQQSTISSSMVKSYSTLAQSLSTGPKLLERYQSTHQHVHAISSHPSISAQSQSNDQTNTVDDVMLQCVAQTEPKLSNTQGAEPMCSKHCLKPMNVESSISAADSTAGNQHPDSIEHPTGPCYARHSIPSTANLMDSSQTQVSRSSDMKVLSSLLLNSNKCIGQVNPDPMSGTPIVKDNYGQNQTHRVTWTTPCGQNVVQTNQQAPNSNGLYRSDSFSNGNNNIYNRNDSIPINGRPITLTPLVSNNVSIPQRQPATNQQTNSKSKTPTFIQPASPSTSSTTSSSGNTEISPSFSITKKPKSNTTGKDSNQSERSGRPSSLSTDCSLSSHDEGFSSQIDQDDCGNSVRDSDDESDIDSDDESFYGDYTNNDLIGASISDNPECKWTLNMGRTRRNGQRRFFWQYNVQSKGPKGTRICPSDGAEDPFVLPEASDPVFSNECQVEGVKHSGKARRGDGNDLTPNPRKLLMIGLELKKLSKIINELAPVTDLPINARNKTRKEKNKLASRACRLKKKAQHEANKIKLYGLQREHQQVVMAIFDARKMIHKALTVEQSQVASLTDGPLSATLQKMLEQCLMTVAGQTGDYVNSVLEKVVSGCIDGGLQS